MTNNRLNVIAISALVPLLVGWSFVPAANGEGGEVDKNEMVNQLVAPSTEPVEREDGLYDRSSLGMTFIPKPANSFWDELARCETGSNWRDKGRFGGGLGIMNTGTFEDGIHNRGQMGTWERWGGEQFAPRPQDATREEQILVANRIAVWGWSTTIERDPVSAKNRGIPAVYEYVKKPVGFNGWGALPCAGGKPKFYFYDEPEKLLFVEFEWMEESKAVRDLQYYMGFKWPTGVYDYETRIRHMQIMSHYGQTTAGIPDNPVLNQFIDTEKVNILSASQH